MELELIEHIYYKLLRKESFESSPLSEKQYQAKKERLQKRMKEVQKEYKKEPKFWNDHLVRSARYDMITNVSRHDYEIIVQDVENFKRTYLEEIPEQYWNSACFFNIYNLLKRGEAKTLQEALEQVEIF